MQRRVRRTATFQSYAASRMRKPRRVRRGISATPQQIRFHATYFHAACTATPQSCHEQRLSRRHAIRRVSRKPGCSRQRPLRWQAAAADYQQADFTLSFHAIITDISRRQQCQRLRYAATPILPQRRLFVSRQPARHAAAEAFALPHFAAASAAAADAL